MRRLLVFALALIILAPCASGLDFKDAGVANKILTDFTTPQLSPGDSGKLMFTLANSHENRTMNNISLTLGIYQYLTVNEQLAISKIDSPPTFSQGAGGTQITISYGTLLPGETIPVGLTISTSDDTPHGDYFSQATYVVRFKMTFDSDGENITYQSRGFFEEDDWASLYDDTDTGPRINTTRMYDMDIDGIIPDTSIGVRKDIPRVILYGLYAGVFAFMGLGYLFYVWENPTTFPKLYRWMAGVRGKMILRREKKK